MIVFTRKCDEEIVIGGNIIVKVLSFKIGAVRIGVTAPHDVRVDRREIHEIREREKLLESKSAERELEVD